MNIRKLTILLLMTGAFQQVAAQMTFWQKFFGGSGFDMAKEVIHRPNGTLVIGGEVYSDEVLKLKNHSEGNGDVLVFNYSTQGYVFWKVMMGGSGIDQMEDIIETKDGGIAFIGTTDSKDGDIPNNAGGTDIWVVKLSASGKPEWSKTFGGKGNDRGTSIVESATGGFLIGGESGSDEGSMRSPHHGGLDSWVAKVDTDGRMVWEKHFGGSANEHVSALHAFADGNFLVFNASDSNDGDVTKSLGKTDVWIFAMDEYGKMLWQTNYGGEANEDIHSICVDNDGNIVIAGTTFSAAGFIPAQRGKGDVWVLKINPQGGLVYTKTFGGAKPDGANDIFATQDGGVVVCGMSRSRDGDIIANDSIHGYYNAFVVKLDPNGIKQWSRIFGLQGKDTFLGITEVPKGGYLAIGFMEQPKTIMDIPGHGGGYDFWLCNFSDPIRPITRAFLTPPAMVGSVKEKGTGKVIEASVVLTENATLDSITTTMTDPEDGSFTMLMPAYGLLSINVLAKGYLFYGEDLLMDSIVNKMSTSRRIELQPIKVGSSLVLDKIYFRSGRWDLLPTSRAELQRLVAFLNLNERVKILITGHTDNTGNKDQKVKLSENRANAVRKYLMEKGIEGYRLKTKGYGKYRPIATNNTSEGRRKNRRVEFEVIFK